MEKNFIRLALLLGKLKKLKREGWRRYGIKDGETVAEHSFRLAVLAMFLAPYFKVNRAKAVEMTLIHDLGEAITGDIVTFKGKKILSNLKQKLEKEKQAVKDILSMSGSNIYIYIYLRGIC